MGTVFEVALIAGMVGTAASSAASSKAQVKAQRNNDAIAEAETDATKAKQDAEQEKALNQTLQTQKAVAGSQGVSLGSGSLLSLANQYTNESQQQASLRRFSLTQRLLGRERGVSDNGLLGAFSNLSADIGRTYRS